MFRFTIRDVLWLTVVVALALGWWNEHRKFVLWYESVSGDFKVPPGHGTSQHP